MTVRMSRRLLLRGLGGAVVAAPFLSSIAERAAKAEGAPAPQVPKRLIVMFTHYGCLTNRWFPANSHGRLTAADYVGTSLEVLAPHANKLLLPRGIRAMNEWTPKATTGQGNDPHTQVAGTYFTCMPVTPHTSDPFSFNAATKFTAKPIGPSLDHVCAKQLSPGGVPLFMRVGGMTDTPASGISYSAAETPFAGFGTPAQALSSLTGLFQPGEPLSPDSYQAVRGKSVLDLVKNDLKTLERFDMSQADKQKLAAWKELLHETAEQSISSLCTPEVASSLGLTEANLQAYEANGADRLATKITDSLDGADLYSNIAALAALCDANRVIFLKYPANYTFKALGLENESDGIAHRIGAPGMGGTCLADVNDMILTIDRYYAQKFAHLVTQLDSFDEGEGKLLDNTAAVWFQQTSDGAAFNLNNMPILQAGSCGGYFKTGCAVNVDDGASDLHRGNSEFPCRDAGEYSLDSIDLYTGTPPEFGNAPINKYYCNLMNAIGVKAGEDGFPLPGGTEEVTHYGMYDRTEDFASGGSLPAFISNPGGFEELKASS